MDEHRRPRRARWPFARCFALLGLIVVLTSSCGGGGGGGGSGGNGGASAPGAGVLRMHYRRGDGAYAGWGVYSWQGTTRSTPTWPANIAFDQSDGFGVYVDLPVDPTKAVVQFLVTDGKGNKNCATDQSLTVSAAIGTSGQEVWIAEQDCLLYGSAAAALSPIKLGTAQAVWLRPDTIVWPGASATATYRLYHAAAGGMTAGANGPSGADGAYDLAIAAPLSGALAAQYPQYAGVAALTVPPAAVADVATLLKGQLVVVASSAGSATAGTQLQIAPVIDAVYAAAAVPQVLGPSFSAQGVPTFRLWAPTATASNRLTGLCRA